jgi:murein L,D-transpeptidase YcbB/YkuD
MKKILFALFLASTITSGQFVFADTSNLNTIIRSHLSTSKQQCSEKLRCSSQLTSQFYKKNGYHAVWLEDGKPSESAIKMVGIINHAYLDGLDPRNYHNSEINKLLNKIKNNDENSPKLLAEFDMTLTDSFFLYVNNLHYGILSPNKVFQYWTISPKPVNMVGVLQNGLYKDGLESAIQSITPQYAGYTRLKVKMNEYQQVAINTGGWESIPEGETMQLGDKSERVYLLQQRLLMSGELAEIDKKGKFTEDVQKAVIVYQQNNGLYDDGIVDEDTLASLNIPITQKIQQMEANLDKMRWLPNNLGGQYIMVNLPEYSLKAVKDNQVQLSMDVAVGGSEHPSCVLSSKINTVVLNPYWNLPTSIAGAELWPRLKTDKNFLAKKHYDVLQADASGKYVTVQNPEAIDWKHMTEKEFNRYRFRQDPGKDNSLGKVKFLFPNPCQIYLHDTNESEVFDIYKRDFSHGCIRVGEPRKLSYYILTQQEGWNKRRINSFYKDGKSQSVGLSTPINLYLTYFTSWVSDDDWAQFRPDIYKLDKTTKYKVYLPEKEKSEANDSDSDSE